MFGLFYYGVAIAELLFCKQKRQLDIGYRRLIKSITCTYLTSFK